MKVIDIFYVRFLTEDGSKLSIGGIQTYISNLIKLAEKMDFGVRIFQFSSAYFERKYENAIVFGVKRGRNSNFTKLYKYALSKRDEGNNYINIIANDSLIPRWKVPNSIVIQHGIGFDDNNNSRLPFFLTFLHRMYNSYKRVKRIQNVDQVVCVDNNYICWYRTQTPCRNVRMTPILNFTSLPDVDRAVRNDAIVRIVFARRFVQIRGTRLFGPVAKRLLETYKNIEIVFAGEGPEKHYLTNLFKNEKRVSFTSYNPSESIHFHQQFDIAVVPTIYSEGTSLSLLEAMSAGCAVVCTNVGGMTNIILDGFNGLMINPSQDDLYDALSKMIEDEKFRKRLSDNAQHTIRDCFSLQKWQESWKRIIKQV